VVLWRGEAFGGWEKMKTVADQPFNTIRLETVLRTIGIANTQKLED
jgi:hypothetical protein